LNLIDKVLSRVEFVNAPPVLVDIGASGNIHSKWSKIAKYSICIAFDADNREFGYVENAGSGFKKLFIYNCIVSEKESDKTDFYLTKSPYCSSTLEPDSTALEEWSFADKFNIQNKIRLNNITLSKVLETLKINKIDWFKTDSQGIDLRLFKSLNSDIQNKVLTAEFEPGIIDAYKAEDKLYTLVDYMSNKNFWLSDFLPKGDVMLGEAELSGITPNKLIKKLIKVSHRASPGWAEITYINSFINDMSLRDYLLGWVFCVIHKQYGFSFKLAEAGKSIYDDKIFNEMKHYSSKRIKNVFFKPRFYKSIVEKIRSMIK
jgi:hypothetical protein